MFATAYFEHYLTRTTWQQKPVVLEICDRFKSCGTDDIRCVRDEALPTVTKTHALNLGDLCEQPEEMLDLASE